MIPDEPMMTTTGKLGSLYLGDVHIFGGNSGSPVLVTFRCKNVLSDVGRLTSCAADMVLGGDFALVHSRARGELTVPA
jgi:hypothetical protein